MCLGIGKKNWKFQNTSQTHPVILPWVGLNEHA